MTAATESARAAADERINLLRGRPGFCIDNETVTDDGGLTVVVSVVMLTRVRRAGAVEAVATRRSTLIAVGPDGAPA